MAAEKTNQEQQVASLFSAIMDKISELAQRSSNVWGKELWTVKDLAEATGWAIPTIYAKVNAKEIPYYKPSGKTLFFVPTDFKEYVLKHKVRSEEEINEIAKNLNR